MFTDEDFRILAYVNELSDKGLNRQTIYNALKQKYDLNSPFPPVHPDLLLGGDVEQGTMLALQEAQGAIARKDAEIKQLNATVVELREQIGYLRSAQEQERAQFNKRIDELMDKYMGQSDRLSQKHAGEIARLSHELGKLRQQVQESANQDARQKNEQVRLNKIVEDLTRHLEEVSRNKTSDPKAHDEQP